MISGSSQNFKEWNNLLLCFSDFHFFIVLIWCHFKRKFYGTILLKINVTPTALFGVILVKVLLVKSVFQHYKWFFNTIISIFKNFKTAYHKIYQTFNCFKKNSF